METNFWKSFQRKSPERFYFSHQTILQQKFEKLKQGAVKYLSLLPSHSDAIKVTLFARYPDSAEPCDNLPVALAPFLDPLAVSCLAHMNSPEQHRHCPRQARQKGEAWLQNKKIVYCQHILLVTCKRPSRCCRASSLSPLARCTSTRGPGCSRKAGTQTWLDHRHTAEGGER